MPTTTKARIYSALGSSDSISLATYMVSPPNDMAKAISYLFGSVDGLNLADPVTIDILDILTAEGVISTEGAEAVKALC